MLDPWWVRLHGRRQGVRWQRGGARRVSARAKGAFRRHAGHENRRKERNMRMTYLACAALALLVLPAAGWAQSDSWDQLPASGAHDEGLGKSSVIKLSSNLSSHSEARRYLGKDLLYIGALRWDKHSGTVWVYKTNAV